MILAGLYDIATPEGQIEVIQNVSGRLFIHSGATSPLYTFTVVTTDASSALSWLHDRQPVILSSTDELEAWLDTSRGWHSGLLALLNPTDGKEFEWYVQSPIL